MVMGGGHQKGCSCQVVESKGRRSDVSQQALASVPPSMLSSPSSCEGVPGVFLPVQLIGVQSSVFVMFHESSVHTADVKSV